MRLRRIAAPAAAGTPLTLADLKKTNLTADFGAGTLGNAGFAAADWDKPETTWVSGAQMSSWIFRKPVGSDGHLTAWLEVRLFAGGVVELLPWVENGYLNVAAPTSKTATYTFKINGVQRFSAAIDLPHHSRTPLISGTALSYWLGDDPDVTPRHDLAYLQATELVPTYSARVDPTSNAVKALAASFTPLDKCNFIYDGDSMQSPGYQHPIGLLPQHDALYLTCETSATYGAVIRNGYAAGRYPIHYRDEKTQRPLRISQFPNLALSQTGSGVAHIGGSTRYQYTPTPTGSKVPSWDCAHSPSVGYLAYLLTDRWYFMEEVQFAATLDYLSKGDNDILRNGAQGLVQSCDGAWQTRATAWQWRTLVQALTVTPDTDTALKQEFVTCVQTNIDHFHGRYIAQPNNPYGWTQPGESYEGALQFGASWQQDFVTAAFGYSLSLGLPVSAAHATKLDAFFRWKARSAVMRLGPATGFWYINAAPYVMSISAARQPDYVGGKGPWLPNDAAVYLSTFASTPAWLGALEGKLAAEFLPGERGSWGNLVAAMAYAVRHGVTGAGTAYQRMVSASNYSTLRDAFNVSPVWSVAPAYVQPAWLANKPLNTWFEIPNTAGAGGAAVDAYSGIAINERNCEILIAAAGGHGDSSDNRVVSISLGVDAPSWRVRAQPSLIAAQNRGPLHRRPAVVAPPLQLDALRAAGQPADAFRRLCDLWLCVGLPQGRCLQPRYQQMGSRRHLGRYSRRLRCRPDPRDRRGGQHRAEEVVADGSQVDGAGECPHTRRAALADGVRPSPQPALLPAVGRWSGLRPAAPGRQPHSSRRRRAAGGQLQPQRRVHAMAGREAQLRRHGLRRRQRSIPVLQRPGRCGGPRLRHHAQ